MDPLKEAFQKVKQDIDSLRFELEIIKKELKSINNINRTQQAIPTDKEESPTIQQINPTETQIPTDDLPFQAPITQNFNISTGNGGVPTDRQTNQQTDQHIEEYIQKFVLNEEIQESQTQEPTKKFVQYKTLKSEPQIISKESKIDQLERVSNLLNSLDEIKKDLRHKFKRLTAQEMLIFSAIYQLEEQQIRVDYPTLASKLSLSESSIRDYVLKITKKGIPLDKIKENNKKILLKIPDDFKKIASLQTILSLREL